MKNLVDNDNGNKGLPLRFHAMGKAGNVSRLAMFLLGILGLGFPVEAQVSNTTPGGFCELGAYGTGNTYLGLLANSDTLVSLPFTRTAAFTGTIQSASSNLITISGSPGWTANQFVYAASTQSNTYYALIGPSSSGPANPKEGCTYLVTANGANTLSLSLNGDTIASIPANSQITLIPYWTLSTLFPASNANVSFTPTTSTRTFMTEVLIPNYGGHGVNLSPAATYYFINSGSNVGWRLFGDANTTNHGDDTLVPDGYIIVSNQNNAPTLPLVVNGSVPMGKLAVPLATLSTGPQDNATAIIRPIGVTLSNCGLNTADGSFVATTTTRNLMDEVSLYNNTQVGFNKSAAATYFYMNNGWRLFGDSITTDHGSDLIPAGSAITIRKAATVGNQTYYWTNAPTY